jgi:hypothetical protein
LARTESMLSLRRRPNRLFFSLCQPRRYLHLFCLLLASIYKELGQFMRCCASEMSWLWRINPYFTAWIPHWIIGKITNACIRLSQILTGWSLIFFQIMLQINTFISTFPKSQYISINISRHISVYRPPFYSIHPLYQCLVLF